ncbi:hypothetical protein [Lacinutrix mariniflava]|uniref:hypothetical protein n=1 Tax=Lacinutrix mariniflava TaxID=342955 RepID=UPI0006E438B8|nr:hypothetical protein [Lacinutrix mariniflava]
MNNITLEKLLTQTSDTIIGSNGRWQLLIKETTLICLTDESNNRMRIISPIIESSKLNEDLKTDVLIANFHTALDVKYAISDNVLWSVFIHPLRELTKEQVLEAVKQVYRANITFGSTNSSTDLIFPSKKRERPEKEKEKPFLKQQF